MSRDRLSVLNKRERRGAWTREINYQKVLLAVHMLTDDDGLACRASIARIGHECGHGPEAVKRSVRMLIERGVVLTVDQWDGLNHRVLILADHPGARPYIADVKARLQEKWDAQVQARLDRSGRVRSRRRSRG